MTFLSALPRICSSAFVAGGRLERRLCVPRIHMSRRVHAIRRRTGARSEHSRVLMWPLTRGPTRLRTRPSRVRGRRRRRSTALLHLRVHHKRCCRVDTARHSPQILRPYRSIIVARISALLITKFFPHFFQRHVPLFSCVRFTMYEKTTLVGAIALIIHEVKELCLRLSRPSVVINSRSQSTPIRAIQQLAQCSKNVL